MVETVILSVIAEVVFLCEVKNLAFNLLVVQ